MPTLGCLLNEKDDVPSVTATGLMPNELPAKDEPRGADAAAGTAEAAGTEAPNTSGSEI